MSVSPCLDGLAQIVGPGADRIALRWLPPSAHGGLAGAFARGVSALALNSARRFASRRHFSESQP